jgi:pheromone shutdown protein TraB
LGEEPDVIVVGTAHVVDLREQLRLALESHGVRGIALELDRDRAAVLLRPEGSADPEPGGSGGPIFLRLWAIIQRRLGAELGQGAGDEMRTGAELAKEWKVPIFLIDDPVRETIRRLFLSLSPKERISLLFGGVVGLFIPPKIVQGEIDRYAESPEDLLEQMRVAMPSTSRVLLDERNEHMAERLRAIRDAGHRPVAAIVGGAHVTGLSAELTKRGVSSVAIPFAQLRRLTASPGAPPTSPS